MIPFVQEADDRQMMREISKFQIKLPDQKGKKYCRNIELNGSYSWSGQGTSMESHIMLSVQCTVLPIISDLFWSETG